MYSVEMFKNADGEKMARIDLESSTLPYVTVDTYQTFTGDSYVEQTYEWVQEEYGVELDWRNSDVKYDNDRILKELAETSIAGIVNQLYDSPIESIEYVSHWSPMYYNFQTDTYTATYTVNWTKLQKWLKKSGKDREQWFIDRWRSYDGFHSYMYPGYWEDPQYKQALLVYATIAMWMEENIDGEQLFMFMFENEYEIFMNAVEVFIPESKYEEMMAAHIAETLGQDFDECDLPLLMEARGADIDKLMQEHPYSPPAAADALMQRPDETYVDGQESLL
jgi:hypothetical protein